MTTIIETRAPTSRKHVAEQGILMPKWSKKFWTFLLNYSISALEKQAKNQNFPSFFLPLRGRLVATFNEVLAPTFRKYVAQQIILMPNLLKAI